mmetsp:Transcript_58177/g.87685  ORF Transcript_58177/g.87685 Transcript_58177/m.87685 type:complete len:89 (+) Transcript_58177:132-398(+)
MMLSTARYICGSHQKVRRAQSSVSVQTKGSSIEARPNKISPEHRHLAAEIDLAGEDDQDASAVHRIRQHFFDAYDGVVDDLVSIDQCV